MGAKAKKQQRISKRQIVLKVQPSAVFTLQTLVYSADGKFLDPFTFSTFIIFNKLANKKLKYGFIPFTSYLLKSPLASVTASNLQKHNT